MNTLLEPPSRPSPDRHPALALLLQPFPTLREAH